MTDSQRTLLVVHAHPDDESSSTGGILAKYSAAGVRTIVVTCTRGEVGEIAEGTRATPETLADVRAQELAEALRILRVSRSVQLGYRDSGMAGTPDNDHPASFHRASLEESTWRLVEVIRAERPQVLVTYDENGGYGHPDHIKANRITVAAYEAAADATRWPELGAPWQVSKLYYVGFAHSVLRRMIEAMERAGIEPPFGRRASSGEAPAIGMPDELITTEIDVSEYLGQKLGALLVHRTQMPLTAPFFQISAAELLATRSREHFRLVAGHGVTVPGELETDLFAGL